MNILIVSNYFTPEMGAAANRIRFMADGFSKMGHNVSVICPMPNYPTGKVFPEFRGRFWMHESVGDNFDIYRFWIYPDNSRNPVLRLFSMLSFGLSLWGIVFKPRVFARVDWVIVQNSPLLVSFSSVVLFKGIFKKKILLNVSDLWPLSALELGAVKKGLFYSFLEFLEKFNYKNSDLIIGQSEEILEHVSTLCSRPTFLYRNLQPGGLRAVEATVERVNICNNYSSRRKIVYAGLLGVAQGIFDIISNVDFDSIGLDLHIFGDGYERSKIEIFLQANPSRGVKYHGQIDKVSLDAIIGSYDASIVPLVRDIKGAVPSKIFELAQAGVPIIFSGEGEGRRLVECLGIGFTAAPRDFGLLRSVLLEFSSISDEKLNALRQRCFDVAKLHFDFNRQLADLDNILTGWGGAKYE